MSPTEEEAMNTPEADDFDPTPYIIPLEQGAPNPYDDPEFAGKQDEVTDENRVEGIGGAAFPESPLSVNPSLTRLHDLVTSHATKMWSGLPIKGYCLAVQHEASEIGALHDTAYHDWTGNPDQHPCTYESVDWSKVPRGVFVYNQSGAGGSGAGHIYRFCGIHNGKPIFCSNDVIPGLMGYLDDPTWFRIHWGQEMVGWARTCNGVWQKGIAGNDGQDQGGQGGSGKGTGELATELESIISALGGAHQKVWTKFESLGKVTTDHPKWALLKEAADLIQQAEPLLKAARTNILTFQKG